MMAIADFYTDRAVLITGGTGFLGKVLLEKLLRSTVGLKCVYCIIRPLNGFNAKSRLEKILQSELFDKVREEHNDMLEKVIPISGNMLHPGLGLSDADSNLLTADVSIIFHCAATIKFDEALRMAVTMNVLGTERLIQLAVRMSKLAAFVHVSTAYANCNYSNISETIYTPSVMPKQLAGALEWMSDDMCNDLTTSLVGDHPNTYTFTKALAEYLFPLNKDLGLPVIIVRPSIVGATWREPVAGWIDNWNGPTGLFAAVGKGLLRSMHGDNDAVADIIPVDLVANLLIVSAWSRANKKGDSIPVINCCSGDLNSVKWSTITNALDVNYRKYPLEGIFRVPKPQFTTNRIWKNFRICVDHLLPAYCVDSFMWIAGKRFRLLRLYEKIFKAVETLEFFTTNQFKFQSDNLILLWNTVSAEDKKQFYFDIRTLDWQHYLEMYCIGVKKYMLKEEMSNLPLARQRLSQLQLYSRLVKMIWYLIGFRVLFKQSKRFRVFFYYLLSLIGTILRFIPGFTSLMLIKF